MVNNKQISSPVSSKKSNAIAIDEAKNAPGFVMLGSANGKYWKRDLTNNHFVSTYKRDGIGRRILRVQLFEMTKKLFDLKNEKAQKIREDFMLDKIVYSGYKNAAISGVSLIYVAYPDVQSLDDYKNEHTGNDEPVYFYVIPKAWISDDAKQDGENFIDEHYEILQDDGNSFKIHNSRIIRVPYDEDESSIYESLWNVLEVLDNMLWSVGQSMWRAAQGFPVLTVENPKIVNDGSNKMKNEVKILQEGGALKNINAMTGFIGDARYNLDFKGAEGKALKPEQYWKIGMQTLSASTGIPEAKIVGANAGAVTGSETNEREFASFIKTKQVQDLQPIYNNLFERFGITLTKDDYEWHSIYEQSQEEQATTLKTEMEGLQIAITTNIITPQQAFDNIKERFPWLSLLAFDEKSYQERQAQRQAFTESRSQLFSNNNNNLNNDHVKKQYSLTDGEYEDSILKASTEPSALPKRSQVVEKKYMSDMGKQYGKTTQVVSNIFEAFESE